jgi:hypothetical protein
MFIEIKNKDFVYSIDTKEIAAISCNGKQFVIFVNLKGNQTPIRLAYDNANAMQQEYKELMSDIKNY